jgi:type I restriction enzyme S subunit
MVKADCFRFRLRDRSASPEFVASFLSSAVARGLISEIARGSTRDRINLSAATSIPIPVPPLAEQKDIVETLAIQLGVMNITRTRSIEMIERLKERRSALITAAVTGQIDVTDPALTKAAA